MRERTAIASLVCAAVLCAAGTGVPGDDGDVLDVRHYDLDVAIGETSLTEKVTVRAAVKRLPARWTLDLAPEMTVVSAEAGGRAVPFAAKGHSVELDLGGVRVEGGAELVLTLAVEGSPLEEQKSRGFVRSAVRPGAVWIRSQHPWYPRAADDPATSRITVDAPEKWLVRTAGRAKEPERRGGRAVWTFERIEPGRDAGLAAGPYVRRELAGQDGVVIDALVNPGHEQAADEMLAVTRRAFLHYAARFGPLAETRWSLVEVPKEFGAGSGYGEAGYLLLGPGAFEAGGANWAVGLVAHEAAHAWWGDSVRFSDFANEALANWSRLAFLAAERGEDSARRERKEAVERVAALSASGREVALADVRGFGGGMDHEVYETLAYEKGMMLLVMAEQSLGEAAMRKLVADFAARERGKRVGWAALADALAAAGPAAKAVLEAWSGPGVPALNVEFAARRSGTKWTVTGRLEQSGTRAPRPMTVVVAAKCGAETITTSVRLTSAAAPFTMTTPSEPESVIVDPDWLVLATRPTAGPADPEQSFKDAFQIVNSPRDADPARCAAAMATLRSLLAAGTTNHPGECHLGIGRLLFRTGKPDDAKPELEEALRIGVGPFHRAWARLRLGCIADLAKKRDDAVAHYKAVVDMKGASDTTVQMAKRFLEKAYRGYAADG